MEMISIREFQLNAAKYLKKLPIMLTRYNVPVAEVQPIEGVSTHKDNKTKVKIEVLTDSQRKMTPEEYAEMTGVKTL